MRVGLAQDSDAWSAVSSTAAATASACRRDGRLRGSGRGDLPAAGAGRRAVRRRQGGAGLGVEQVELVQREDEVDDVARVGRDGTS